MKKQVIISNGIKPTDNGYDRVYEVWKNGSADRVFDTYKEARDYVEKESKSGSTYAEGGGIDSIKYRGTIELEKGDKIRIDHPHIKGLTLLIIGRRGDGYDYKSSDDMSQTSWANGGWFDQMIRKPKNELVRKSGSTYAEGGEIEENNGDITVAENKIKDLEFYPNYDAEIIEVGLGKKRVDAQIFFDADGRDYILINDKINYVDDLGFEIYSLGNSENTGHFGDLYEDDFLRFEEEGKIINLNNDLSADERGAWHYYFISDDKYANEISKKLITKN